MIGLTRVNGTRCRIDPDSIQRVEAHPDTVVFLTDGVRYRVVETVDEVIDRIRNARAGVVAACYVLDRGEDPDPLRLGAGGNADVRALPPR